MSEFILNGRAVENVETEIEVGEGCCVVSAQFADDGSELSEAQCLELEEIYQSDLYQNAYEHLSAAAYDRAKDAWKYGE